MYVLKQLKMKLIDNDIFITAEKGKTLVIIGNNTYNPGWHQFLP
jgi:hypothetical protein